MINTVSFCHINFLYIQLLYFTFSSFMFSTSIFMIAKQTIHNLEKDSFMTDSRATACRVISVGGQNMRFGRHAFYARRMRRRVDSVMVAAECYGPRCMAENTPPWPCWYPLARFYVHATKQRLVEADEPRAPCSCATRKSEDYRVDHSSASRPLFFLFAFPFLVSFLFVSPGNPASPQQFLQSQRVTSLALLHI